MKRIQLIYVFIILMMVSACHKDEEFTTTDTTPVATPKIFKEVVGDVIGYVYDEDYKAVKNAKVKIYNSTTTTDEFGVFRFDQIKMDQLGTYIKIDKEGFIAGSDYVYPKKGTLYSYTNLLAIDNASSFVETDGGRINIEGGGTIDFKANSIVDLDGNSYSGKVNVTAKRLSTSDSRIEDKMPGGLRGIASNGNSVVLATYGMLAVELRSESGVELNIKAGMTADIVFPISSVLLEKAPASIPLWYFDEEVGLWKEEGQALLVNGNYEAEVKHFSWWNLDAKFPTVYLCVNVFFDTGEPATNYRVGLEREIDNWTTYGTVDGDGSVCGLIPKNEVLTLKVVNAYCNQVFTTLTIGPFNNDVQLDDIIIPLTENLGGGQVVCNGAPVDSSILLLTYVTNDGTFTMIVPTDDMGNFNLAFTPLTCTGIISAELFAYNPSSGDASPAFVVDVSSTINNIEINICNNCIYTVEIVKNYTDICDVNTLSIEAVATPAGNYTYTWSNGGTSPIESDPAQGLWCVTVSPVNDNCPIIKCLDVKRSYNLIAQVEFIEHPFCNRENGQAFIYGWGGVPPYSYEVTGPNGFTASEFELQDLAEGSYIFKVTDDKGCVAVLDTLLEMDASFSVDIRIEAEQISCDGGNLFAQAGFNAAGFTYTWSTGESGVDMKSIVIATGGNYCVTLSDGVGCEVVGCIDVDVPILEFELESCENGSYRFWSVTSSFVDVIGLSSNGKQFTWGAPIFNDYGLYDVIEYGYEFELQAASGNCQPQQIEMPHYLGQMVVSITDVSCGTCEDGHIELETDLPSSACRDCLPGEMIIFNVNNPSEELSVENNSNSLPAGDYIVIMRNESANSGNCFIDHEYVTIN